jgi:hypothetical protein
MTNNNINNYYDNIGSNTFCNEYNNILFNFINSNINNCKDNNYCFNNYSKITSGINNYYNIISQLKNDKNAYKDNNNHCDKNNFPFSLSLNPNKNDINYRENKSSLFNSQYIIQKLNQMHNLNNIKFNNFNIIGNTNNIEFINNNKVDNNISFNSQKINISKNSIFPNSLEKMINNNDNTNLNQNTLNDSNSNYNNKTFINDSSNSTNINDIKIPMDKNYIKEFMRFVNNISMPLVEFLCTPKGTLEIQKQIEKGQNQCKILLIKLLKKEGLSIIMKNTYGNYFFQQLIKGTQGIIISRIISYIYDEFVSISKDPSGTFSIQALLNEISSIKEEQQILMCIQNHEIEMAFDKNATYVLQKIILLFPDIHRVCLNEIILNNFKDLCMDSNGICLVKNFIKTNTLSSNKKRIIEEISKNFVVLADNPYGNYGIQYIMDNWDRNEFKDFIKKIMENIFKLSIQQFSSNVVEKAIEKIDDESREKMIRKLCFESNFIILLKNKFGRFVLQKAISHMSPELKNEFENNLVNKINSNIYSHKDKNKVRKFVMKIMNNQFPNDFYFESNNEYFVRNNMNKFCNYEFNKNISNNNF